MRVSVNRIVKQGEELYDDPNKIQVNEENENDVKDFGNKIVEVDDIDMEDSQEFAQGRSGSIESTLEEMNEEEINQHNNKEEINNNLAEIVHDGRDIDQHDDGKQITILIGDNMKKRKI